MKHFTGQLVRYKKHLNHVYQADIQILEGHPPIIGRADKITFHHHSVHLPVQFFQSSQENIYRLFLTTSTIEEKECQQLLHSLHQERFFLIPTEQEVMKISPHLQKMVVLIDESAISENVFLLDYLIDQSVHTHIYMKTDDDRQDVTNYLQLHFVQRYQQLPSFSPSEIATILQQQTIGTQLLIVSDHATISVIKELANHAGFTEEDILEKLVGPVKEHVFCVKCYHLNEKQGASKLVCSQCKKSLDVSNHFSRRHNAYLGYITIG